MKKSLFSVSLYREMLRQLRVAGLTMLVVFTVFDVFGLLMDLSWYPYSHYDNLDTGFHPALNIIPYIAPTILTLMAFHFQNSRRAADFYHSLPYTKAGLCLSVVAAVATWCAIITLGSSLITGAVACLNNFGESAYETLSLDRALQDFLLPTVGDIALISLAAFAACLFMTALTFLSTQLSGNTLSSLLTTAILLFAPYMIVMMLTGTLAELLWLIPSEGLDGLESLFLPILLFDLRDAAQVWPWVVTVLATVVLALLGLWCASRRPSETAGKAGTTYAVQVALRTLLGLACCLPAIVIMMVQGYASDDMLDFIGWMPIVFNYLLVAGVYFLFELFTTRKAANLLRAVPWFIGLLVLNVVVIGVMHLCVFTATQYRPDAEDIDSVTVTYYRDSYYYGDNVYPNAVLTDEESRAIIAKATANAAIHAANDEDACTDTGRLYHGRDYATIEVEIHDGIFTRSRHLRISEAEMEILQNAILDAREDTR